MKKCPKCGYERTQKDEAFISAAECPKCGVFYEKEKAYVAKKKEMAEAEQLNVAEEEKRREEERLIAEKKIMALKINNAESQKGEMQIADEKKCKYCSMMIPADAKICPHCRKTQGTSAAVGCLTIIVVIFGIGFLASLMAPDKTKDVTPKNTSTSQTVSQPTQHQEAPSTNETLAPDFNPPQGAISAKDLYDAYKANEVAADEKFKGKRLVVYGKIKSISKNIADQPSVTLDAGTLSFVDCRFPKDKTSQLVSLQKGQMTAIECTANYKMVASVFLYDCEFR